MIKVCRICNDMAVVCSIPKSELNFHVAYGWVKLEEGQDAEQVLNPESDAEKEAKEAKKKAKAEAERVRRAKAKEAKEAKEAEAKEKNKSKAK